MKRYARLLLLFPLLLLATLEAFAQENGQPQPPTKYRMELVYIFNEDGSTEFVFVIGAVGFKTVESLKKFLSTLPAGSEMEWAPGCKRMGSEPLLSSEWDMEEFKRFCAEKSIKFVLVPSG